MPDGNSFGGQFTLTPSVRIKVQTAGLGSFGLGPRIVAIIGNATGGQPGTIYSFTSPNQATPILRGGELLQALFRAFNPGKTGAGPATVFAVRVNPATQATTTLKDALAANSIVVTSSNWGAADNLINISVAAGSVSGKKVTVANATNTYVLDNLGKNAFSVQYTGAGTAATMTISGTTLTTSCTGASADNLNLAFTSYTTVAQLVGAIVNTGKYTATVLTSNPNDPTTNNLDFVTAQDIKTAVYTETMNLSAIIAALNGPNEPLVSATRASGAGAVPANTTAPVFLTGGTDNGAANHLDGTSNGTQAVTNADWGYCLGLLDTQDVRYVAVLTSDSTTWALADQHAQTASAAGYLPRRNFLGTALGLYTTTLGGYLPLAAALNSNRTALVPQGLVDNDDQTGVLTTFPPYMYAAQLAGLQAAMDLGNAITHQYARGIGLEWMPNAAQVNTAIGGGLLVSTFNPKTSSVQVVRGIETWLVDNSFQNTEISVGDEVDDVIVTVLERLQPFIGVKGSPPVLVQIASATQSALQDEYVAGVLVGDAIPQSDGTFNPPYENITVSIAGDVATVTFTCQVGIPLNFINITMTLNTYSGTLQVAAA